MCTYVSITYGSGVRLSDVFAQVVAETGHRSLAVPMRLLLLLLGKMRLLLLLLGHSLRLA